MTTYIGRNGNTPHGYTSTGSGGHDGGKGQIGRSGWRESLLQYLVGHKVARKSQPKRESINILADSIRRSMTTHAALPGPSLAKVAPVPRKILLNPPSLYNCRTTSIGPEYEGPAPAPCP